MKERVSVFETFGTIAFEAPGPPFTPGPPFVGPGLGALATGEVDEFDGGPEETTDGLAIVSFLDETTGGALEAELSSSAAA